MAAPTKPNPTKPITYILAGDDDDGAFKAAMNGYAKDPNVVILRASDYPKFEDALAQIKPPANVVLACHGTPEDSLRYASFMWRKAENTVGYSALGALNRLSPGSIGSISLLSCYGEAAFSALEHVPAGTVLLSLIGKNAINNNTFNQFFQAETVGITDPALLVLEALDNVSPDEYREWVQLPHVDSNNVSPLKDLLPTIIGIGGKPPITINLDDAGKELGAASADVFNRTTALVKKHFDVCIETVLMQTTKNDLGIPMSELIRGFSVNKRDPEVEAKVIAALKKQFPQEADKITATTCGNYFDKLLLQRAAEANAAQDKKIDAIAQKMKKGEPIALDKDGNPDLDEVRIRRALGVAYLKESGEMDRMIEQAKQSGTARGAESKQVQADLTTPAATVRQFQEALAQHGLNRDDFQNFAVALQSHPQMQTLGTSQDAGIKGLA